MLLYIIYYIIYNLYNCFDIFSLLFKQKHMSGRPAQNWSQRTLLRYLLIHLKFCVVLYQINAPFWLVLH